MTRRLLALAALLPGLTLTGCIETDTVIEIKAIRITQPGIPIVGAAVLGIPVEVTTEFDLGSAIEAGTISDSATVELTVTSMQFSWSDPATRPDFSGITAVSVRVEPDAASGLTPVVIASYVQDPANPNPDTIALSGNPDANIFDLLTSGGTMTLVFSLEGSGAFNTTATTVIELNMVVTADPLKLATGG